MPTLADARLAVQRDLSRVLASARDVREAAPAILEAISGRLGCVVSEMWVIDEARPVLQSVATWCAGDRFQPFLDSGKHAEFERGQGLPGLAWECGASQWMTDVSKEETFARKLDAIACGLHAAVAFPIVYGGVVTGVVQFFFPEPRTANVELMTTFADIGEQLGLFLERARIDATALKQAQEILELSAPILRVAPNAILLPVIGSFDAKRASHVSQKLLERVVETGSTWVVIDVTGAASLETFTAHRLLDTIAAVRLLGATTILTGVQAAAARTLVLLGVELGNVVVRGSLADGLAFLREQSPQAKSGKGAAGARDAVK
jgi:anti-anti-sigma regulatory factor